jgi:hypothetical protein
VPDTDVDAVDHSAINKMLRAAIRSTTLVVGERRTTTHADAVASMRAALDEAADDTERAALRIAPASELGVED